MNLSKRMESSDSSSLKLSIRAITKKSLLIQLISYSSAIIISLMINGITQNAEIALFVSFFTFPAIFIINLIYCWLQAVKTYKGRNAMIVWLIFVIGIFTPVIILSLATVGCLSLTAI